MGHLLWAPPSSNTHWLKARRPHSHGGSYGPGTPSPVSPAQSRPPPAGGARGGRTGVTKKNGVTLCGGQGWMPPSLPSGKETEQGGDTEKGLEIPSGAGQASAGGGGAVGAQLHVTVTPPAPDGTQRCPRVPEAHGRRVWTDVGAADGGASGAIPGRARPGRCPRPGLGVGGCSRG